MRNLEQTLMMAAVAVALLAVLSATATAQGAASRPAGLGGGQASVMMVSDNASNGAPGRGNDSQGVQGQRPGERSQARQSDRDDRLFGHRSREQHHRDVNRGWGLLGLLLFL
jgi:hypothetical protein